MGCRASQDFAEPERKAIEPAASPVLPFIDGQEGDVGTASPSVQAWKNRLPMTTHHDEQNEQVQGNVLRNAAMVQGSAIDQQPSVVEDAVMEHRPGNAGPGVHPGVKMARSSMNTTFCKPGPGAQRSDTPYSPQRSDATCALQSVQRGGSLPSAQKSGSSPSTHETFASDHNFQLDLIRIRSQLTELGQDDGSSTVGSSARTEVQDDVSQDPHLQGTPGFWGALLGPGVVEDLSGLSTEDVDSKRLSDDFVRQALQIVDAFEASKGLPPSSDWMNPLTSDGERGWGINPIMLDGDLLE